MSCSFKSIQFGAFSLIKDAHSSRREADTVCDLHSQTSFALAALANHIHAHSRSHAHAHRYLFGRGFLFIQHRVLPGSPIQKALRTDATDRTGTVRGPRWALRRIGYAGCWCGAAVPACSGKGPFLSLWRWEAQGSTRSFISAGSLVGEWIPSGSCPHLQRYSRKPSTCSRDRLCHSSSAAWKLGQMERAYSQKRLWFVFTIQACSGSAQMKDELCGKQNQQTAWQGVLVR